MLLILVILINIVSHFVHHRFDLTQEKRYTLAETTKTFLEELDDVVFIKIYLAGDNLPAGFRRLQKSLIELMDEFRVYAGSHVEYELFNPSESPDPSTRNEVYEELARDGMMYFNVTVEGDDGSSSTMPVFASAMVTYRAHGQQFDRPVNFFQGNSSRQINDATINRAIENLEYEFTSAMRVITRERVPRVAMIQGHGELDEMESYSLFTALSTFYRVEYVEIEGKLHALDEYSAIIIADPKESFNNQDQFIIDQYILRGGRVLWLVDAVKADMNVLADTSEVMSTGNPVRLGNMIYNYGVQINPTLVQDLQCVQLPVNMAAEGQAPNWQPVPFYYFPLISANPDHPITRNLNLIKMEFASPLDTVGEHPEIRKEILLTTSEYTRIRRQPVRVSFDDITTAPDLSRFPMRHLPVAVLLEGRFTSYFRNRLADEWINNELYEVLEESKVPTRMIVIGDGDVARNFVSYTDGEPRPHVLGFDRFYDHVYANKDLLLNCMNYLLDDEGVMGVRTREVRMRLLDYEEMTIRQNRWKVINLVVPVLLVALLAIVYLLLRRRKYTRRI